MNEEGRSTHLAHGHLRRRLHIEDSGFSSSAVIEIVERALGGGVDGLGIEFLFRLGHLVSILEIRRDPVGYFRKEEES